MIHLGLKEKVVDVLSKHLYGTFGDSNPELIKAFDFENRFRVLADTDIFDYKLDEYVWNQKKGNTTTKFQVYFDGEFMFSFDEEDIVEAILVMFFRAFREKIGDGTIKLIKDDYRIEHELKKAKEDEVIKNVRAIKPKNQTEAMAKEVLTKVVKDKKDKDALVTAT